MDRDPAVGHGRIIRNRPFGDVVALIAVLVVR